jgi:heme/copper-type cytochrome/quinol oxidase subunit 1
VPGLSLWFIGAAMAYLVVGAFAGAVMLVSRGLRLAVPAGELLSLHIEFMLVGWAIQLAMGVAYWILPRHKSGPGRGNERLAWSSFVLLNVGVLLAALGGIGGVAGWLSALGHVVEITGAGVFALNVWRRLPRSITPVGRSLPIV